VSAEQLDRNQVPASARLTKNRRKPWIRCASSSLGVAVLPKQSDSLLSDWKGRFANPAVKLGSSDAGS
jgi:hypothetical protein